jgi:hypothetical protein
MWLPETSGEVGDGQGNYNFYLFVPVGLQELFYMP